MVDLPEQAMHPRFVSLTYKSAGVDIDRGDALIERIRPLAAKATRAEVVGSVGGFAGLCSIPNGYADPVLVSGTDGVGTKLAVALLVGEHRGIGIDLVAMAVNDIITVGAEPLFFLDYFATGRLDVELAIEVIAGIADGCSQSKCALLGGETAELPGLYSGNDYDLAGFAVGVVERAKIITGESIKPGDAIVGIASSGLHSNGFSLARRALLDELGHDVSATPSELGGRTLGATMLEPTTIYVNAIRDLLDADIELHGLSHITGGGLIENPPRMLPTDELAVSLDVSSWLVPPIFELIASAGVETAEMRRTFNMGIGMLIVVDAANVDRVGQIVGRHHKSARVGRIIKRTSDAVEFHGLPSSSALA